MRRVHTELLVQIAKDKALSKVIGEIDFEQDDDSLTYTKGPVNIQLAGGATATEIDLPVGATTLKFLAVYDVVGDSGINIYLSGSGNDPILVTPPGTDTDKTGTLLLSTSATSLHVSNPSATASVTATILMACS